MKRCLHPPCPPVRSPACYPQQDLRQLHGSAQEFTSWLYYGVAMYLLVGLRCFRHMKYHPSLRIFYTLFRWVRCSTGGRRVQLNTQGAACPHVCGVDMRFGVLPWSRLWSLVAAKRVRLTRSPEFAAERGNPAILTLPYIPPGVSTPVCGPQAGVTRHLRGTWATGLQGFLFACARRCLCRSDLTHLRLLLCSTRTCAPWVTLSPSPWPPL